MFGLARVLASVNQFVRELYVSRLQSQAKKRHHMQRLLFLPTIALKRIYHYFLMKNNCSHNFQPNGFIRVGGIFKT